MTTRRGITEIRCPDGGSWSTAGIHSLTPEAFQPSQKYRVALPSKNIRYLWDPARVHDGVLSPVFRVWRPSMKLKLHGSVCTCKCLYKKLVYSVRKERYGYSWPNYVCSTVRCNSGYSKKFRARDIALPCRFSKNGMRKDAFLLRTLEMAMRLSLERPEEEVLGAIPFSVRVYSVF